MQHRVRFGERDRLRARDHLIAELERLPHAGTADVEDVLRHRFEHGAHAFEHRGVAADHHRERARLRADRAARERRFEHADAALGAQRDELLRGRRIDRRRIDERG